jgi:hypothetical protein
MTTAQIAGLQTTCFLVAAYLYIIAEIRSNFIVTKIPLW